VTTTSRRDLPHHQPYERPRAAGPVVRNWSHGARHRCCGTDRRERGSKPEPNGPRLARYAGRTYNLGLHRSRDRASVSYPLTACRSASTCLTCSCPASRANFSVTYAHVAAHPHEQVGRLTSRLPSFSERIVMLWVTLLIFLLLPETSLHSIDLNPVHRDIELPVTTDEKITPVTV
jgi:hypothetical protein